ACAASRARLVLALRSCVGACGLGRCCAFCGCAHRRGDEAGLSRHSRAPGARAARACARAGTRSFASLASVRVQPAVPSLVPRGRSASALTAAPHIRTRTTMAAPAAMQGETVRLVIMTVLTRLATLVRLMLLPSDE